MQWRMLAVLLWKHLVVRMRRFFHTPTEILSPMLFFLILYLLKSHIGLLEKPVDPRATDMVKNTETINLESVSPPKRILYKPKSPLADSLMESVGASLNLNQLPSLPMKHNGKGYHGFSNLSQVATFISKIDQNEAIVLFDDLEGDTWPKKLTYTIRMGKGFSAASFEPEGGIQRPHAAFGMTYEPFMRLQWAIDTNYLKLVYGANVTQDVYLQEFPFYEKTGERSHMTVLAEILILLCWMSLTLMFVFLITSLLEERATGVQELIKMVGVSSSMLGVSHFINTIPAGLVYSIAGAVFTTVSEHPILSNTNGFLIFVALFLHYVSVVALAFACSYITNSARHAVSLAVFMYIAAWLPTRYVPNVSIAGLLPHRPITWFWANVGHLERYGNGLSFSNIAEIHDPSSESVLASYIYSVIQALIFFAIAWYLSNVRPGKYGLALPWDFLFQAQYWSKNEVKPIPLETEEELPITNKNKFFEDPPLHMQPGIKIENVTKVYPKQTALNNVSLDIYKGEITVLLGHNGAGKTTLISIITGMITATSGRVYVNGMETSRARRQVMKEVGLCPQHNLFFPDLTVLEHVIFFTLLKGASYREARLKSRELLDQLGLSEKAGSRSAALSGGMKRRLQLACALAGDASVLVLDEPTAGLDVQTRRGLWDLLLSLRGSRTVVISTHFMEEADALGDRVAALHLGRLRSHASPMYLKRAVGTGYRLTLTTNGTPREGAITSTVTSHVADATIKDSTINSLTYNLPASASAHFPSLFTALENNKSALAVETIGVGVSTLDDVFMKLCSDTDVSFTEDEVDSSAPVSTREPMTGCMLYLRQFWYLWKRQVDYIWDHKYLFALLQVIMPILTICSMTLLFKNTKDVHISDRPMTLNLDIYTPMHVRRVLGNVKGPSFLNLGESYSGVLFEETSNITEAIIRAGMADSAQYSQYIAGIEMDESHIKIMYTTLVRHAAPVAMNLATNLLASRYLPETTGRLITTMLHPVMKGGVNLDSVVEPKDMEQATLWAVLVVFVILSTTVNLVSLPCKERVSGVRHIHVMSGCPAALHWLATALFHLALLCVTLLLPLAVVCRWLETDRTFDQTDFILTIMLALFLSCMAFLAFMYLVSLFTTENGATTLLIFALILFGTITTSTKTLSDVFDPDKTSTLDYILSVAAYTMPPHAATMAVGKAAYVARINAFCLLNTDRCPLLFFNSPGFDVDKCCSGQKVRCYMCRDEFAPWQEMIVLFCQFVVYMALVILTERGVFSLMWETIRNRSYRVMHETSQPSSDDLVRAEALFVSKHIALPKKQLEESHYAVLVNNLHKNYTRMFGKPCNAVKGISLSVKKGECFGLLGVNGAGKSTTFKMLTAEEWPTIGDIYANGHFREAKPLSPTYTNYVRSLGYCPQFAGVDPFMSGRGNLELLLVLRGLRPQDVRAEVDYWIKVVGLEKYSSRRVSSYSGGCARRLGVGAALCAGAGAVLLDEPTAGVDVGARRRVWAAMRRTLLRHRAVLISSHSMDEIEALCARIAIMSGGVIRSIGTAGELRARHAAGHSVVFKLTHATDAVDGAQSSTDIVKSTIQSKFQCTLKDEHKTMLYYHIHDTMRYSELFTALENLKKDYPNSIEDYSATETTLEEVFLSFAREAQDTDTGTNNIV